MIRIGTDFQLSSHIDLSILDNLSVHVHKYGSPQPDAAKEFYWMQYRDEGEIKGTISFARHLGLHWPEIGLYVADYVYEKTGFKIDPVRIAFMLTQGSVTPHRDEGGRRSCINIGIRNSDAAITRMSLDNDFDTFDTEYEDFQVEDGCAYLVNVDNVHAVFAKDYERKRLLITCSFPTPYLELVNRLKR